MRKKKEKTIAITIHPVYLAEHDSSDYQFSYANALFISDSLRYVISRPFSHPHIAYIYRSTILFSGTLSIVTHVGFIGKMCFERILPPYRYRSLL